MQLDLPEDEIILNARQRVANAITCLEFIESDPSLSVPSIVATAINEIVLAASTVGNISAVMPETAQQAAALVREACPAVAADVKATMPAERVYFLLGCVGALLTSTEDPFRADRLSYAAMAAAELTVAHHRRGLNQRGFPLVRAIKIHRASIAERCVDDALH